MKSKAEINMTKIKAKKSIYGVEEKMKEYQEKYSEQKGSIKSLKWNSYASAATRYNQLISDLDFHKKTILDIGCGFGDIIPVIFSKTSAGLYANDQKENIFEYVGVDMVAEFIGEAKKRYPEFSFSWRDYFSNPMKKKFDIILCCGALNSNYEKVRSYRERAIKTMFENCNIATAFNMAGSVARSNVISKDAKIFYANPSEILTFCARLTEKIIFKKHYHKNEFTIVMFK